jgi:hypothetical protein
MTRTLDEFQVQYPDADWLEDRGNVERWSNGLGEGTIDESVWFCRNCGDEAVWDDYSPTFYSCEKCDDHEE